MKKTKLLLVTSLLLTISSGMVSCSRSTEKTVEPKYESSAEIKSKISEDDTKKEDMPVCGEWVAENGILFTLGKDDRYGYYKNSKDTSDNYYKGPLAILQGNKALDELEVSQEEFNGTLKEYCGTADNVYSISMTSEMLHSSGIDKPYEKKTLLFKFMFVISKEDKNVAEIVDVDQGIQYKATKVK